MDRYVEENGMIKDNMEKIKCRKRFCFGPGKIYEANTKYVILIVTKSLENVELIVEV